MATSGGWPSIANLIGQNYHPKQYGRVWGYISTSSRFGTVFATLVLGFSLVYLPWRYVLYLSAGLGIIMVVIWYFLAPEPQGAAPKGDRPNDDTVSDQHLGHPLYNTTLKFALLDFLKSKRVWLIFLAMMGLTIMVDFFNFVPIFLNETLNISGANAVMISSALPSGAIIAVLAGGYVFDSLSTKTLAKVIGISLSTAVLCIIAIYNLASFSLSLQSNLIVIYICLFVFGLCVAPAYYLPMSIFSINYGGPHSGILISILDIGGFFSAAAFAIITGKVSDTLGWDYVLLLVILIGILTLGLTVWFLHNESKVEKVI